MPPPGKDSDHKVAIESDDRVQSLGILRAMHHFRVVEAVDKILCLRPPNWDLETILGECAGGTSISP